MQLILKLRMLNAKLTLDIFHFEIVHTVNYHFKDFFVTQFWKCSIFRSSSTLYWKQKQKRLILQKFNSGTQNCSKEPLFLFVTERQRGWSVELSVITLNILSSWWGAGGACLCCLPGARAWNSQSLNPDHQCQRQLQEPVSPHHHHQHQQQQLCKA